MDRYELPDPTLRAYDQGVGELRIKGELRGYLASVFGEIKFPGRSPWPWFVLVWSDGTKERSFEDYGPGWFTVRALDSGYLNHCEEVITGERRGWFGFTISRTTYREPRRYDFAWLPATEAAAKWIELGLKESDF